MNNSVFTRLWAILRTDAVLRLRRTSTLVLMLFVSFLAYSSVPDPATGRGLFVINGARTLYNSASIAFATSMLLSLIGIGLFGFYMISNTIRRDVDSRVGNVLAATPMRSWEYIVGKFLGNVAFLSIIALMFMVAMMVMYAFRGEASFEMLVFVRTYGQMCISAIVFVAVVALVFESLPVLSGRVGDVGYFFVWVIMIAMPLVQVESALAARRMSGGDGSFPMTFSEIPMAVYMDVFGMGTGMAGLNAQMPAANNGFSIGASPFDPQLAPIVLQEVRIPAAWLLVKLLSVLAMSSLLMFAYITFHRFDPTKVRASVRQSKRNIFAVINTALKPLTRMNTALWGMLPRMFGGNRFVCAVAVECLMLLTTKPVSMLLVAGLNIAAFVLPMANVQGVLLPLACVALVILSSDTALRERQRGTTGLVFSLPAMKLHFVWIKLLATFLFAMLLVVVPFVRIVLDSPNTALSLVIGMLFLSAAAVGTATASGTSKVFVVGALVLFYLSLSTGGASPALDFGGWFGTADTGIQAVYAALAGGLTALGYAAHWWRTAR
jgi:ABC-type transport system involved in multi-copper enzyme maturation permease subunit